MIGNEFTIDWSPFLDKTWEEPVDTTISPARAARTADYLTQIPPDMKLHGRVQRIVDERGRMARGEIDMDWGFAESMAYASMIEDGYDCRLVGQDSGRGTFFHRHAVLHNQVNNREYTPLAHIVDRPNAFRVIDSLLSEEAVLGFEYGYATTEPNTLVIWEGQFGDFVNGAQVVIDQFISSGDAKWGRLCGMVLFLPHGYEGQGPEHSSARLERFLQLCAEHNMQVCVPSTPAQMFHMLRRQMIRPMRKPLIVMTPKSLLRHKQAVSDLDELATGQFLNVIGEVDVRPDGSACFQVPAGVPLYFMVLDAQGQAIQRMRSFTHFMPGEVQGCIGCHEHRRQASRANLADAFSRPPVDPTPPEWWCGWATRCGTGSRATTSTCTATTSTAADPSPSPNRGPKPFHK